MGPATQKGRGLRIGLLVVVLTGVVVAVLLIARFAHDVRVGLIGFVVGVLVARLVPPLWRWLRNGD